MQTAVGRFLSETRKVRGLTLDQIAGAARQHGATWSASSVGNIEKGQASLTLPNMILLALALSTLTEQRLTLNDLLGDAEQITLTPDGEPVRREWLDAVLSGEPVAAPKSYEQRRAAEDAAALEEIADQHQDMPAANDRDVVAALLDRSQEPPDSDEEHHDPLPTLAEQRAAQKLEIAPAELQHWAQRLWGRPLEAESAHRAGSDSTPQARGRVTRHLVDEIRAAKEQDAPFA